MQGRPAPLDVYLDTRFIVSSMMLGAPHNAACLQFSADLIAANSRVYISALVWLEWPQALRALATKPTNLPAAVRATHRLDHWGTDSKVRQEWLALGLAEFEAYLSRFAEVFELPWDQTLWAPGISVICQHGLNTMDAMHVATTQHYGIPDLATVDDDFQRVTRLTCWLIHDPPSTP